MTPVTDPNLLAQLEGGGPQPVTDPGLLAQLESQPDVATDVAKATGAGLAKGGIDVLGMRGDIANVGTRAGEWLARKVGVPDQFIEGVRPYAEGVSGLVGGPGSQKIQETVEGATGEFYEPQTTAGEYAGAVSRMAPAALFPASRVGRAANVAVPGVASETGRQAFEGTAAEPYAQAGGALIGAMGAGRVARAIAPGAKPPTATDRIADVLKQSDEAYKSPAIASAEFRPGVADAFADVTLKNLDAAKRNVRVAPVTRAYIEDFKTPINGKAHTFEDFQTLKTLLGEQAGNFANPAESAAASLALKNLKQYLGNTPQAHLSAGDAAKMSSTWRNANADYAAGKTAQRVQEKLTSAERSAAAANSGANVGNRQRQKLNQLLSTKKGKRGLTDEEGDLILEAVEGSKLANVLRTGGNLLGGGGGLGALVSATAGGAAAGPLGLALPIVGRGLKSAGDKVTQRQANRIVDAILSRAPATQGAPKAPALNEGVLQALTRAMLAAQSSSDGPLRLTVRPSDAEFIR